MKKYYLLLVILFSCQFIQAQDTFTFTQNAMQLYDFRFKGSGFEDAGRGSCMVKTGEKVILSFEIDTMHDYIFLAFADSTTKGILIEGRLNTDSTILFQSDENYILKDAGAQILIYPVDDRFNASMKITMHLMGKKDPEEPTYYLLFRKLKTY